jgi:hypothetical protein
VRKIEVVQIGEREPADPVMLSGARVERLTVPPPHSVEGQTDFAGRYLELDEWFDGSFFYGDADLLHQLPDERALGGFAQLDVASWQIPNGWVPLPAN